MLQKTWVASILLILFWRKSSLIKFGNKRLKWEQVRTLSWLRLISSVSNFEFDLPAGRLYIVLFVSSSDFTSWSTMVHSGKESIFWFAKLSDAILLNIFCKCRGLPLGRFPGLLNETFVWITKLDWVSMMKLGPTFSSSTISKSLKSISWVDLIASGLVLSIIMWM